MEVIIVSKDNPVKSNVVYRAYDFDKDIGEAIKLYVKEFGEEPALVYKLRKMILIPDPNPKWPPQISSLP